jgi:hypothetical protein
MNATTGYLTVGDAHKLDPSTQRGIWDRVGPDRKVRRSRIGEG